MLNLINADADIVKPAVSKECMILFNGMAGNTSAWPYKKIETTDLSIRHRIRLTLEVISVKSRVSRNECTLEAGNRFCDMINGYFSAVYPKY